MSTTACCMPGCCPNKYTKLSGHLLLSYFNGVKYALPSNGYCAATHVVTITRSTIQNGWTALKQASRKNHQKVVEVLLRVGANPDLQNKVRTGWDGA